MAVDQFVDCLINGSENDSLAEQLLELRLFGSPTCNVTDGQLYNVINLHEGPSLAGLRFASPPVVR